MLISKYSRSEDGGRDSVAFLYDKLKDNLDKDSSVDIARENQPSPSPFKENNCYFHSEDSVTCKSVYCKDTDNSQKEYIVFTDEGDSVQSNKGFETVRNNNHYEELSDDSGKSQAKLTLGELANQHSNNINECINYCNDKEIVLNCHSRTVSTQASLMSDLQQNFEKYYHRALFFENLLRSREETIRNLHSVSLQFDAVSTELKNSRMLESHLQTEVNSLKTKYSKQEERLRELKEDHFKQAAELRQASRLLETKQAEAERVDQMLQRMKTEISELQIENIELRKSVGQGDRDREILVQKIRRLETEIVKRDAKMERMARENRRSNGSDDIDSSIEIFGKLRN